MFERNLGNIERVIRLLFGIGFGFWAFSQPYMNPIEWFVIAISLMLILNGIFSRCFIWWALGLNTFKPVTPNCD
ncbi:DUF2892 domain-containing protein [Oceanicoccus sp. KOV_DT_Chl]|uniref:YgaP family membrane protein n=1 Tax=Oceanicoccus sp. KOV_DT_Chl TaxID=1904639 RepID=UPI000C7E7BD1